MEYIGIDLHQKEGQICRLNEADELIERRTGSTGG